MTPSTTPFDFGDLVLVPFPFTDQTTSKKRPAIVISSVAYNRERPDLIFVAVTSQIRSPGDFGQIIIADWKGAGLPLPSAIKPLVATIEKGLVVRKLGRLAEPDRRALQEALRLILG